LRRLHSVHSRVIFTLFSLLAMLDQLVSFSVGRGCVI
jgi:hypothetical protein